MQNVVKASIHIFSVNDQNRNNIPGEHIESLRITGLLFRHIQQKDGYLRRGERPLENVNDVWNENEKKSNRLNTNGTGMGWLNECVTLSMGA